MSKQRRTMRIPDDVTAALEREGAPQPLWYVGTLQAENGRDLYVRTVSDGEVAPPPAVAGRPRRHPDDAED